MKDDIVNVKTTVEEVLASDPRSRADDKWLIFQTLRRMGFNIFMDFDDMPAMPSLESITRARRKFQHEGHYLPPKEVDEQRKDKEKEMKKINDWWR